eukprot:4994068-Pleurochrysis_carterae.AAC.2
MPIFPALARPGPPLPVRRTPSGHAVHGPHRSIRVCRAIASAAARKAGEGDVAADVHDSPLVISIASTRLASSARSMNTPTASLMEC